MSLVLDNGSAAHVGYYMLNQQGDVIAILDETGGVAVKVVSYEYNAWGQIKEETATSTNVGTLFLEHNALKYRGYYYDAETGFYYLENRYYDPVIGRFINADGYVSTGTTHLGYNMYAYCLNNPVNMSDVSGDVPEWLEERAKKTGSMASAAATAGSERKKEWRKKTAEKKINSYLSNNGYNSKIQFNDNSVRITYSYEIDSALDRYIVSKMIENTDIAIRSAENMSCEWLLHNIIYDVLNVLRLEGTGWYTSAKDADIDYVRDNRLLIWLPSNLLDIQGWV